LTTIEPDEETGPINGVRIRTSAPVVDQDNVTDPPGPIEVDEAASPAVGFLLGRESCLFLSVAPNSQRAL
jgi:hypothetical protein